MTGVAEPAEVLETVGPTAAPASPAQEMRRTALVAATLWLLVHLVHAAGSAGSVVHWPTYVAALVLWAGAAAGALAPLVVVQTAARERAQAAVVAALVPVVNLLDVTSVRSDAIASYANWANGGSAVMLAALVLRVHGRLALAAGVALVTVEVTVCLLADGRIGPTAAATLVSPTVLWLAGSWAVRGHLRHARVLATSLRSRRAAVATERLLAQRWADLRRCRWRDLEDEVLPLLGRVAATPAGHEVDPEDRARARELASSLRDALLARTLMNAELRRAVAAARHRGVRVMLHNALEDGRPVDELRDLASRLLLVEGLESLSVRTFQDPLQATLVLRFGAEPIGSRVDEVSREVDQRLPTWRSSSVHDLDDVVMVELTGRR